MNLGKLVEVHSDKDQFKHCEVCDSGGGPDTKKWWEFTWFSVRFECQMVGVCLECCKHKGTVVDWREE